MINSWGVTKAQRNALAIVGGLLFGCAVLWMESIAGGEDGPAKAMACLALDILLGH
jgi:hypothetical protein